MEQNLKKLQQEARENYELPELSLEQVERLNLRMKKAKQENQRARVQHAGMRITATAAAVVLVVFTLTNTSRTMALAMQQIPVVGDFVKLLTVREYEYEDTKHHADINIGQLIVSSVPEMEQVDKPVKEELQKTIEEINMEIEEITLELVEHFEEGVRDEKGYEELIVKNEVLVATKDYFVLELSCYQGTGSGYQWNYYYTIDLNTGKRLQLENLFVENADYLNRISDNIRTQMKNQMKEDENKLYWLDSTMEVDESAKFYINGENKIVICFDEGEVAPMYMGAVAFVIDEEVLAEIRK